jgi:GNAT superfamily N-acetyltransferase
VAVAPDLQGRGIGRRLMEAIETALSGRVTRFELSTGGTSEGNLRFYRSLGYIDIGWRRPRSHRVARTSKNGFDLFFRLPPGDRDNGSIPWATLDRIAEGRDGWVA